MPVLNLGELLGSTRKPEPVGASLGHVSSSRRPVVRAPSACLAAPPSRETRGGDQMSGMRVCVLQPCIHWPLVSRVCSAQKHASEAALHHWAAPRVPQRISAAWPSRPSWHALQISVQSFLSWAMLNASCFVLFFFFSGWWHDTSCWFMSQQLA